MHRVPRVLVRRIWLAAAAWLLCVAPASAGVTRVSVDAVAAPATEVYAQVGEQAGLTFQADPSDLLMEAPAVTADLANVPLWEAMVELSKQTGLWPVARQGDAVTLRPLTQPAHATQGPLLIVATGANYAIGPEEAARGLSAVQVQVELAVLVDPAEAGLYLDVPTIKATDEEDRPLEPAAGYDAIVPLPEGGGTLSLRLDAPTLPLVSPLSKRVWKQNVGKQIVPTRVKQLRLLALLAVAEGRETVVMPVAADDLSATVAGLPVMAELSSDPDHPGRWTLSADVRPAIGEARRKAVSFSQVPHLLQTLPPTLRIGEGMEVVPVSMTVLGLDPDADGYPTRHRLVARYDLGEVEPSAVVWTWPTSDLDRQRSVLTLGAIGVEEQAR